MSRLALLVTWLLQAPIRVYRLAVSPFLLPSCRFAPTCSEYAIEALAVHGPLRGLALALNRLRRCHPVSWLGGGSGFDPVPRREARSAPHTTGQS